MTCYWSGWELFLLACQRFCSHLVNKCPLSCFWVARMVRGASLCLFAEGFVGLCFRPACWAIHSSSVPYFMVLPNFKATYFPSSGLKHIDSSFYTLKHWEAGSLFEMGVVCNRLYCFMLTYNNSLFPLAVRFLSIRVKWWMTLNNGWM